MCPARGCGFESRAFRSSGDRLVTGFTQASRPSAYSGDIAEKVEVAVLNGDLARQFMS
jgi:hypothetical protein